MTCNLCGDTYRGIAADCSCTMYGYASEEEMPPEVLKDYREGRKRRKRIALRTSLYVIKCRIKRLLGVY